MFRSWESMSACILATTLIVFVVALFYLGGQISTLRKEAVDRGYAQWVTDSGTGKMRFNWK
jgi:hypothetical protein